MGRGSKKVLKAIDLLAPWLSRKSLLNSARARRARGLQKKSTIKCSTCKTSQGVNLKRNPFKFFSPASIFQRNPFKNFFHFNFFPVKSLVKNSKLTFNFT